MNRTNLEAAYLRWVRQRTTRGQKDSTSTSDSTQGVESPENELEKAAMNSLRINISEELLEIQMSARFLNRVVHIFRHIPQVFFIYYGLFFVYIEGDL